MYPVDLLILLRERRNHMLFNTNTSLSSTIDELRPIDDMIQFIESEILPSSVPCELRESSDHFILEYGQGDNVKCKSFKKKENLNMKPIDPTMTTNCGTFDPMSGKMFRTSYDKIGKVNYSAFSDGGATLSFTLTEEGNKEMKKLIKRAMGNPKEIEKVIFNDPATIVFWGNGDKTVVKCGEDDIYDPEKGLAMAISKRFLGNQGNYFNVFKKWLPKKEHRTELSEEEKAYIKNDIESVSDAVKRAVNRLTDVLLKRTTKELVDKSFDSAPEEEIKKLEDESQELLDIWKDTK